MLIAWLVTYVNIADVVVVWLQIRTIDRKQEVPHDGAMCDLLWSDPGEPPGHKARLSVTGVIGCVHRITAGSFCAWPTLPLVVC